MSMYEQWWLHCTSQWEQKIHLSEHVYSVATAFKITEWVEQRICIKFCIKLQYSSAETIRMIQKAAAMGNWWLAASLGQSAHLCIMYCAGFFGKTSNHPGDSAPLQLRFNALRLLAFPKTKITFEREEISDYLWDSGKYDWAAAVSYTHLRAHET